MLKVIFQTIKNRTLIDENNLKNYLSNTSWLSLERAFRVAVSFFVGIYVARFLGPEKFGLLSYAISFSSFFSALTTLGLEGILVKELVHTPQKQGILVATAFYLKTCGALLSLVFIVFSLLIVPHDSSANPLILICTFAFLFQSFNVIELFFQSKIFSKYVVFAQLVQIVISAIIKLAFIFFKMPLAWFAWALVFDSIILAIGMSVVYFKYSTLKNILHFDSFIARKLVLCSFPLFLSEIAIAIYMRIDQIMIKSFLTDRVLGCYAAAVIICESFYFIPLAILRTFFPVILNNKKESETLYYKNLQKLYDLMVIISFFISILITIAADKIVLIFFGTEFRDAIPVLRIYVWASIFVFLGAANERWLWAENLQRYAFYRTLGGCFLSVGLNLILVPWLNIQGAAITAFISFGFVSCISFLLFKPTRNHFFAVSRSLNILSGSKRIFQLSLGNKNEKYF